MDLVDDVVLAGGSARADGLSARVRELEPRLTDFEATSGWEWFAYLLADDCEDLLAHLHFPVEHGRRLHPTNPL